METVTALVEQALAAPSRPELLRQAAEASDCARDRQVVAVAAAYLRGDGDRAQMLARDHLADHPDSVLVSRIAALTLRGREDR
jgi:hypothetical protein